MTLTTNQRLVLALAIAISLVLLPVATWWLFGGKVDAMLAATTVFVFVLTLWIAFFLEGVS